MNNEEEQNLKIDARSHKHLMEISKWVRFIGITGIVISIMMAITGLAGPDLLSKLLASANQAVISPASLSIIFEVVAAICFFPSIFLYKFSVKLKSALANDNQQSLNEAFLNLKYFCRFIGVIAILYITFSMLGLGRP